jgi:hypothetical protein
MRREKTHPCSVCGRRYRPTETRHMHMADGTVVHEPRP